jgi:sugar (pentulose or hexulose) kinase
MSITHVKSDSPCFLGIDAGTTSLKAALFDLDGHLLALDRQEYQLLTSGQAVVEAEPEIYWQTCCRAVRQALEMSGVDLGSVTALCISSQGETFIPVDKDGLPTRRAIVWLDNRAVKEARQIQQRFGIEEIYRRSGQPEVAPTWPACKILWMRRHEPEIFARSAKFLLLEDFLLYRMTGQYVTEVALQTSSLLLDIQRKAWWPEMLDYTGITADRLGRLMDPGEIVAPLTLQGAAALGLTTRTLAVTGSMDQAIGALGAGNIVPDVVTEATGGAMAILVSLDKPLYDPQRRIPCYFHARKDTYCLLPWVQTAGMALKWFRDQFFALEAGAARENGLDPYDRMTEAASQVPPGAEGLVVLPHLEGAFCPEFNPAAKAVFYGATLRHTRAHFIRAILESVAFMLKKNLDLVEGLGVPVNEIRSIGGGARSDLWLQIKADVLQKPIIAVEVEEASLLGAALTAATAAGGFTSLEEGVARMVRIRRKIEPDPSNAAAYRELYDRLAPMFR